MFVTGLQLLSHSYTCPLRRKVVRPFPHDFCSFGQIPFMCHCHESIGHATFLCLYFFKKNYL